MEGPPVYESGINATPVERPATPIRYQDLVQDLSVLRLKEASDKDQLLSLPNLSTQTLKDNLLLWAQKKFPPAFPFYKFAFRAPERCSDGISRSVSEYISYLVNTSFYDLLQPLRSRLSDFVVSYATTGDEILLVVSLP